jgi:hypothetical protein
MTDLRYHCRVLFQGMKMVLMKAKAKSKPAKKLSDAEVWLNRITGDPHALEPWRRAIQLYEAAADAAKLFTALERSSAVRLPFPRYGSVVEKLRAALE